MLNNIYTLIIPTHNRVELLKSLIDYLSLQKCAFKILVLDSSDYKIRSENQTTINKSGLEIDHLTYQPEPDTSLKIQDGLEKTLTKYASLCADDDFISILSINQCVDFLTGNPDYSCAIGQTATFGYFNSKTVFKSGLHHDKSIEHDSPVERFVSHFTRYSTATFYAVHRTELLRKVFQVSSNNTRNYIFSEYIMTLLTLIEGKLKVFDSLYSVRMHHDPLKLKDINFYACIMNGSFDLEYKKFRACLSNALSEKAGITVIDAGKIIDESLRQYFRNDGLSLDQIRLKAKLKKILGKTGLLEPMLSIKRKIFKPKLKTYQDFLNQPDVPYFNPSHPDHKEFMKIKEIIEKHGV